jgi:hypothetical protein
MVKTPTEREGEFVKTWYLVGFESRYNEMKEVAAEFGVTNN